MPWLTERLMRQVRSCAERHLHHGLSFWPKEAGIGDAWIYYALDNGDQRSPTFRPGLSDFQVDLGDATVGRLFQWLRGRSVGDDSVLSPELRRWSAIGQHRRSACPRSSRMA